MKNYLSFGGGVNSTALMLYLSDHQVEFESIFANHETDLPETYEYVEYLRKQGYQITEIKPNYQGYSNLYEYCRDKKFLPSMHLRWCTYRFKLKPIWNYVEKPCIMFIGICFDERHRVVKENRQKQAKEIKNTYPLVEAKITRHKCKQIIQDHGLKLPVKSGCWICPFQGRSQLIQLYSNHPELFSKLVELEKIRGNRHTLKEKPITYYVPWKTEFLENYI